MPSDNYFKEIVMMTKIWQTIFLSNSNCTFQGCWDQILAPLLLLAPHPPTLCFEWGFTWTFPRNQDATVKLKSELISIKF